MTYSEGWAELLYDPFWTMRNGWKVGQPDDWRCRVCKRASA